MIGRKKTLCKSMWILFLIVTLIFPTLTYADSNTDANISREFSENIKQILNSEIYNGAIGSIVIRSAETGEIIFSYNEDIRLNPASNLKLITGAAALDTLGKDYRWSTQLYTDGIQIDSTLKGNLYLKGTGDPTMLKKDYEFLVNELVSKGMKEIEGNLILDDTYFDHVRLSNDMEWGDEPYDYGAQISALTISPDEDYNAGTVLVTVKAGDQIGSSVKAEITPKNDYVTIENKGITTKNGEPNISVEREHGTNKIVITGSMPFQKNIEEKNYVSVWEPTQLVGCIFSNILKEKGMKINGNVLYEKTPNHATLLVQKKSMPLSELMIPFEKLSNNGHAEILVKTMGKIKCNEGSWDHGLKIVNEYLKKNRDQYIDYLH
ncbi:D-alanyl-D-alanine carboxypeptidase/D-alanyl-D-alanine endopeptidase [Inediibacterium massiliense]|uniref:D-alanyl-D-alanine carboxypeptidase/D-alanyl-D-alanine endopeptidase n=1 Tax=Inediibacterium massiliense TaxID=1658111 RepID=UPI0006B45BF4|nr:D-alanyl-D-alanine carboxypeptidase/D-alanyl-D-alanine-endopeptidase [Inediibacterium massiliense]